MSYEALSTYIREENGVFLQVCCAEECDVGNRECAGELIVNIGGLRRHLLRTVAGVCKTFGARRHWQPLPPSKLLLIVNLRR